MKVHVHFCPFKGGGSVVVDSLFIVPPLDCWGSVFGACFSCITDCSFLFCNHLVEEERA